MKPGNTPLIELHHLAPAGTRLFAKLEWHNPTGSIKDRAAWFMFRNAQVLGALAPGQPLIEATSGNTGIGLARLALVNGHPMLICLPKNSTEERKQLLRAYGAELHEVQGGPNDAIAAAKQMVSDGEGHMLYQYGNRWNPYAHFFGTALELLDQWALVDPPSHVVASYGTGGTLTGISRGIKLTWPDVSIHGVEEDLQHPIGGMRSRTDPFQPPVADLSLVDSWSTIGKQQADVAVQTAMKSEGLFLGTSSGAIILAAQELLAGRGGTAIVILPDAGWKYLSGSPWNSPSL